MVTRRFSLLFALGFTFLQALPWLPLLFRKISPVAFAAESVGYRYFHSFRLLRGDKSGLWLPQGQTLGVIHEFGQYLLDWSGVIALRTRMDLFGYGTLTLNSLLFGCVLYGCSRTLSGGWKPRLLLAATALFGIYGSWWGLFSARLPDYCTFETTLTVLCMGWSIVRLQATDTRLTFRGTATLGALAGMMAGVKFTLLPAAFLPLLPDLLRIKRPVRLSLCLGLWLATAMTTLLALLTFYYRFDFDSMAHAYRAWRSFVSAPGAEPGFISSLLHPFRTGNNPWADHRFIPVVFILWLTALVVIAHVFIKEPASRREYLVLGFYVLSCSALHIWAVLKRPAETTLFDASLFLVAIAAALLASLPNRPPYRKVTTLWLSLVLSWCLISGLKHFPSANTIASMEETSRNTWEMHHWLNATGRPVVVLLPDNRYVSGTVEETLLKGFSDMPTWNITTGRAMLNAVAPNRLFVTQLSSPPPGSVVLWTDVPGVVPLVDLGQVPLVVLGQVPVQVRSWQMQSDKYWPRTVHAAVFDSSRALPSGSEGEIKPAGSFHMP